MKKYCIIIFNPLEIPNQGFDKIASLVFKQNNDDIQSFVQNNPTFWKSEGYSLEVAQTFRHKLIKYSNLLNLELVLKMELNHE